MKNLRFLLLFACLLIGNAAFAQGNTPQEVIDQLIGNWKWTYAQGGFTGESITPASLGLTASYAISQPSNIGEDSIVVQTYTDGALVGENKVKVVAWNTLWAISGADIVGGIFGTGSTFFPITTLNTLYLAINDNVGDGYSYEFTSNSCDIEGSFVDESNNIVFCSNSPAVLTTNSTDLIYPLSYLWNTGQTSNSINGVEAGTYTVTITDTNNNICIATDNVVIIPATEIAYNIEYVGNNQIVHRQISGGLPSLLGYGEYMLGWEGNQSLPYNPELSYATYDLIFPCSSTGPFSFAVYGDGVSCSAFITINLAPNCPPISITSSPTPTSTCNACDGTIDISVSNGNAPYTYQWSNGSTAEDQANLCAGTYTITVTDADGYSTTNTIDVIATGSPIISNISLDCNLGATSITVFATDPNSEPLEYALNGSNYQTSNTFTTIPDGVYTVIVRNTISNCITAQNYTVNCFPIFINAETIPTSTCNTCDGGINISVNGGSSPPYTFQWNNGSTAQNQTNLCAATYTVTVTDTNGNTATQTIDFTNPTVPIISNISVECNDATNTVSVMASTISNDALEYAINGVSYQSSNTFTTVANGTYPMFVRNTVSGCINVQNFTVNCSDFSVTTSSTPTTSCNACNGTINININGGTAPYTYQWNTGANFPNMVNLCSGTYTITVTDANNNTSLASVVVNEPTAPLVSLSNINDCDATSAVLDPGNNFASYFWNTGSITQTLTITNSGTYTVTVTAANNCTATAQSIATINCSLPTCNYSIAGNNTICEGQFATLNALGSGLTPPLSYLWNTGETTASITTNIAGTYSAIVSDVLGNSCQAATILTVNPTPNFGVFNTCNSVCVDCFSCGDGLFNYIWSNGETNPCLNNPLAGSYTVTITNSFGCSSILSTTITNNALSIDAVDVLAACEDDNGSICVDVTGGISPYTYLITNSIGQTTFLGGNSCANNLTPDTYTMIVTDANGCNTSIIIPVETQPIVVSLQTYSCGEPSITFTAPDGFVSYQWSTGETTNSIVVTDYTQGYNVTVTAANGCTVAPNYSVVDVDPPIVNLSDALACNGETITLDAGTDGVTYQWSTAETTNTIDVNQAGLYFVSVTNFVGCTTVDSAFVSVDCNLYPGDANNDGEANYIDLLSIGNSFGSSGAARINATNNWEPQQATYWGTNATNGMDLSYTDCNGDGIINAADTTAISLNYGNQHQAIIINTPQNFNVSLQANPANEGFIDTETAIIPFDVVVTNPNNTPLNEIYGIGFKLHYTSPTPAQLNVEFENAANGWSSYLGSVSSSNPDEQILTLVRNFVTSDTTGELHIALTKINGQSIEGSLAGVCRVIATVTIDTWGIKRADTASSNPIPIAFNFDGVTLTTTNGTTYQQTAAVQDTIYIPTVPTGIKPIKHNSTNWLLYPNPANDYVTMFIQSPTNSNQSTVVNLYDAIGRLVLSKSILPNQNSVSFSTANMVNGLYYCWYNNTVQKMLINK